MSQAPAGSLAGTTHLVTGVAGQDGIHLARQLLAAGARVVGAAQLDSPVVQAMTAYLTGAELVDLDVRDGAGFAGLVERVRPDVVHNLAAISSVGASWDDPDLTRAVNQDAVLTMLDALRGTGIRFVHASSSEIFGPVEAGEVDESTPLNPVSPYAESKAAAHLAVAASRAAGDLAATNVVLFGHTSALHATRFVLRTITRQAAEVARGTRAHLRVDDPTVRRDWGSAPDFVRAFLAAPVAEAGDYVIATGSVHSLHEVIGWAAAAAGLEQQLPGAGSPTRRNDFGDVRGNPARAAARLGWRPSVTLEDEITRMVGIDLRRLQSGVEDDPAYLA